MTTRVPDFAAIGEECDAYVGAIGYATMVTVDARHRPRTRVLIPAWEAVDGAPLGWLATFPTPVKLAHLAGNPHANCSYRPPGINSVAVDAGAPWTDVPADRRRLWQMSARA